MDKKINLSQLAELLSQAGGMSKAASEQFVKSFFDIISQKVLEEGIVKVKGLGTFKLLQIEDRESVNVNTGERFTIEGHQKISFIPDADLKERINIPFAAFDSVQITEQQAAEINSMEATERKPEPVAAKKKAPAAVQPRVKDVTQNRRKRFWLRTLLIIAIIALIVPLGIYLLWPVIGCNLLDVVDRKISDKSEITATAMDSAVTVEVRDMDEPQPEAPVSQVKQETPAPVKQESKPAPAAAPASAKPAAKPAQPKVTQTFKLNAEDEAKDLSEFTEDDTENYNIVGRLTVHTLQKGETLTKLALMYYGSKKLWPYIAKYNSYSQFDKMLPGYKVYIPKLGYK